MTTYTLTTLQVDGHLTQLSVDDIATIEAQPNAVYSLLDELGIEVPDNMVIKRIDGDLVILVDGEVVAVISEFFAVGSTAVFDTLQDINDDGSELISGAVESDSESVDAEIWSASSAYDITSPFGLDVVITPQMAGIAVGLLALMGGGSSSSSTTSSSPAAPATAPSGDTTAPSYVSTSINTSAKTITFTFSETLDATAPPSSSSFTITHGSVANPVASVSVAAAQVTLTLTNAIGSGTMSIAYTDPSGSDDTNAIQDSAGNDAASFTKTAVAGVVADGYIRAATVFVDTDGDGVYTAGTDIALGETDANGAFFVPDGVTGTVIASGGVNIDTGLPNSLTLKAPEGASVINPMTTLVQEYIETYSTTAADAQTTLMTSLGLGSSNVDLMSYDPLANADATGLAIQKAAAQIATFLTLVYDNPNGVTADTALSTVTTNLITAINSGSVDLTDTTEVSAIIGSVTTATTSDITTANTNIQNAADISSVSLVQSTTLDTINPGAPTLTVAAASDTGSSSTDAITNNATPVIKVSLNTTATDGTAAVAGDTVAISGTNVTAQSHILTAENITDGYAEVAAVISGTPGPLSATITDAAGNASATSSDLTITLDEVDPTISGTPSLSSSGAINSLVNTGDIINATVTMDEAVTVSGTPELTLNIGGTDVVALYVSGSGTANLVFQYTIVSGQTDADGISIAENSINLAGGSITDIAGNTASITHVTVSADSDFLVDAVAPGHSITTVDANSQTITFVYDTPIDGSNMAQASAFSVTQSGISTAVNTVAVVGSSVTITLDNPLSSGDISIVYTDPTASNDANAIQDLAGNDVSDLSVTLDSGVVVDGYVRNADIYVDTNDNGTNDAGTDYSLGQSDANGVYFVPQGITGNLIITGGTNIDTGLPNTLTLKAPVDSVVVSPLTTLVIDYMASYSVSSADAKSTVMQALGLDSNLDPMTYDPLAEVNADATGLSVQKVAAQIATIYTLVEANPDTGISAADAIADINTNLLTLPAAAL